MQELNKLLDIYQQRGVKGLPLERVYRQLFNPDHYLRAYGKIYRNFGAMTPGATTETVDGMKLQKIHSIIDLLKWSRYRWMPVRRVEIPKENGKMRPLGIPSWSDKLVQEVVRALLEAYYEQRFSSNSHGFRPGRGCHSALHQIKRTWVGTVWFIEGDIKGYFDNIDHSILLDIIRRDIHDGRIVALIDGMIRAGYLEDWQYFPTLSGTPQGGIISPLLANIYLNELDRYVEDTLIPHYQRGDKRKDNPEYVRLRWYIKAAVQREDFEEVKRLKRERRKIMSVAPIDPDYRRLRYIRYADDFLLGFIGPKNEAEEIRGRIGEFLSDKLKLTLSTEKTLITHANDDCAKFLGYEISVTRSENQLTKGRRAINGQITLRMPRKVVQKYLSRYSKKGKIVHRKELTAESDFAIIQRYQGVLRGIYNYYCMAMNVSGRMNHVEHILSTSLAKTLGNKFKVSAAKIFRRYKTKIGGINALQTMLARAGKAPLVATFGGFSFKRIPAGMGIKDINLTRAWYTRYSKRTEVVQRLLADKCELCGITDVPLQVHHIRKLADINRPGRRPRAPWEFQMCAMKRKTLIVCEDCHQIIHGGVYDGAKL